MPRRIATYLDANSGAPVTLDVAQAIRKVLKNSTDSEGLSFGLNPSSIHAHGRKAKRLVNEARESIAASLSIGSSLSSKSSSLYSSSNIDPEQLIFTSSGTEANQTVIRSALKGRSHWITSVVEHDSVLKMVEWFRGEGGRVDLLPCDEEGRIEVSRLENLLSDETALVSLVWVNNEMGVVTDVENAKKICGEKDVPLHLDGAQAWGKWSVNLEGVDFLTLSAHKIGGLAGTGVIWCGPNHPCRPLILGNQEKGRRGGTENLIGIVAAGAAASEIDPKAFDQRLRASRDRFEAMVLDRIPGARVNGADAIRVANTSNISFNGVAGESLVMGLDMGGFSVSSGSACSSGVLEPSHVLLAMGRSRDEAMAAIRVSTVELISEELSEAFVECLEKTVARVRQASRTENEFRTE